MLSRFRLRLCRKQQASSASNRTAQNRRLLTIWSCSHLATDTRPSTLFVYQASPPFSPGQATAFLFLSVVTAIGGLLVLVFLRPWRCRDRATFFGAELRHCALREPSTPASPPERIDHFSTLVTSTCTLRSTQPCDYPHRGFHGDSTQLVTVSHCGIDQPSNCRMMAQEPTPQQSVEATATPAALPVSHLAAPDLAHYTPFTLPPPPCTVPRLVASCRHV